MGEVSYTPIGTDRFECTVVAHGQRLTIRGSLKSLVPERSGSRRLVYNDSLVESLFAYAKHEHQYRRLRAPETRKLHGKERERFSKTAAALSEMAIQVTQDHRSGWCSCCLQQVESFRVGGKKYQPPAYLCGNCGAPVTPCAVPRCGNLARRSHRTVAAARYCAEHRHDIAGFDKMTGGIDRIDQYQDLLDFEKRNFAKGTKYALAITATAVAVAPAALVAAPAIGGALGASALGGGLSGAAATSHGLAMLGFGSVASGGLGMAGGTAVVTAVGAGLGGAMGAVTTSAYVRTDKSFRIQRLKGGSGTPVLVASGFLTEGDDGWGNWRQIIEDRYPNSPVYRVHWGSKELKAFALLGIAGIGKAAGARILAKKGAQATVKGAAKVPGLGALFVASDLAANPWTVAVARATMTGSVLADLIVRTKTGRFVLVGHSLGARVMYSACQVLGTVKNRPRVESVHLLGAAVTKDDNVLSASNAIAGSLWNYRSDRDAVLRHLYRLGQLGKSAVGVTGFNSKLENIKDRNVSGQVSSHSEYFSRVTLA